MKAEQMALNGVNNEDVLKMLQQRQQQAASSQANMVNNPGCMVGEIPRNYDMAMQEHLQDDEQLLKQLIQKKMMQGEGVQTQNAPMGSG